MMRPRLPALLALATLSLSTLGAQATLPAGLEAAIAGGVVEVVIAKAARDNLSYAESIPVELIPFAERNDGYLPLGTAFSLGAGRFVTAAHVLGLGEATLRGPLSVRNAEGRVFPIGQVSRYSTRRDFAVFSVEGFAPPALPLREGAALNSRVFACGNALGQGIILRDGLLTSTTREEREGAWAWLRFSAPASPGNSGGPLFDDSGRVIGLIVMKSDNENLNYALPVSEFAAVAEGSIELNRRLGTSLPELAKEAWEDFTKSLRGPLGVETLRAAFVDSLEAARTLSLSALAKAGLEAAFPPKEGAGIPLDSPISLDFPFVLDQGDSGSWSFVKSQEITRVELRDGGRLSWGAVHDYVQFSLSRDGTGAGDWLDRPGTALDRVLEAYPISRKVGGRSFRITSMGEPVRTAWHRDAWGRTWLLATWALPLLDYAQVAAFLPTPDGFAGFMEGEGWREEAALRRGIAASCDYFQLSYRGGVEAWRSFLASGERRPAFLEGTTLGPGQGEELLFATPRFSIALGPESIGPLSGGSPTGGATTREGTLERSPPADAASAGLIPRDGPAGPILRVVPWWFREGGRPVLGIQAFSAASGESIDSLVLVEKRPRPGPTADEETRRNWEDLREGSSPWDRRPSISKGNARVSDIVGLEPGADPDFIYSVFTYFRGLTVVNEARDRFMRIRAGLRIAAGEARAGRMAGERQGPVRSEGLDLFEAIAAPKESAFAALLLSKEALASTGPSGRGAIGYALAEGRADFAIRLIAAGAPTGLRDAFGSTPLAEAIARKQVDVARRLVRSGVDVNLVDGSGLSALVLAMPKEFGDLPDLLLAAGADPKAACNALAVGAALHAKRGELARRLIADGFPVDAAYPGGWSPLLFALREGDSDLVRALLARGAAPGRATEGGWSPLHEAVNAGSLELLRALLEGGAPVDPRAEGGWTPLLYAAAGGREDLALFLLDRGARVDAVNERRETVLHLAARSFGLEGIARLLDRGALRLAGSLDAEGRDPAYVAELAGRAEVARMLGQLPR